MEILRPDIATPLYQQIYDILCEKIERGIYRPGDKIPSEDTLCEMYKVSRVTVRSALQRLVEENILVKRHGKGTFVAVPAFVESMNAQGSFTKSCLLMNIIPSTKLVSRKTKRAGKIVSKQLGIEEGQEIICVKRLRLTNDVAAIFEVDYFRGDFNFMLSADVEQTPIMELIEASTGLTERRYMDTFEVRFATKEQAYWLDCPVNTPLLGVNQVIFSEQRSVIYYNEQYIRSDIYKYVAGK